MIDLQLRFFVFRQEIIEIYSWFWYTLSTVHLIIHWNFLDPVHVHARTHTSTHIYCIYIHVYTFMHSLFSYIQYCCFGFYFLLGTAAIGVYVWSSNDWSKSTKRWFKFCRYSEFAASLWSEHQHQNSPSDLHKNSDRQRFCVQLKVGPEGRNHGFWASNGQSRGKKFNIAALSCRELSEFHCQYLIFTIFFMFNAFLRNRGCCCMANVQIIG